MTLTTTRPASMSSGLPSAAGLAERCRALLEADRPGEVVRLVEASMAASESHEDLLHLRVVALRRIGVIEPALEACRQALRQYPHSLALWVALGNLSADRGDGAAAVEVFGRLVAAQPDNAEFHRMLGIGYRYEHRFDQAEAAFRKAMALTPGDARPRLVLAMLLEELGRVDEARAIHVENLKLEPTPAEVVEAYAGFLRRRGELQEAIAMLEGRIAARAPASPALLYQLGRTLLPIDRERGNGALRAALAAAPHNSAWLTELAESLDRTRGSGEGRNIAEGYRLAVRRLDMGRDLLRDARALRAIFIRAADFARARQCGSAGELGPYWARTGQEGALHTLIAQVDSREDRRALVDYHRQWGQGIQDLAARSPLDRSAPRPRRDGRIRVGFMSSDLRNHPVAYFAAPLLTGMDRGRFEVYCYAWNTGPVDAVQQAIAARVDTFRHHPALGDRAAAQCIADDHLDVLFELGGSTDMNRIRAMAWRPAPRQASWLGYPHSCGLTAIDRIVTDPFITPADRALLIERPLELRHSWVAFNRPGFGPAVGIEPLTPQERTGVVTFGTMNNPQKYNPRLLATWAEVMRRVPGSRFLFVRPEGASEAFRGNVRAAFAAAGVEPERVEFVPVRGDHLRHYNDIDVALDTFPQTGGTTTCETLWMGVPVAALAGEAFFERLSFSNLNNAGFGAHCANTPEAYVEIAVALAQATDWRREYRARARDWLAAHPLGQVQAFVRDFEDAIVGWMDEGAGS